MQEEREEEGDEENEMTVSGNAVTWLGQEEIENGEPDVSDPNFIVSLLD